MMCVEMLERLLASTNLLDDDIDDLIAGIQIEAANCSEKVAIFANPV